MPILFVPGIGTPGSAWNEVVAVLAPRYRCMTVSVAGFAGQSPVGTPDFQAVRDALTEAARTAGGKAVLVGHSFGGSLALAVASRHPDLFSHVIIVDAYPFPLGLVQPTMTAAVAAQSAQAVSAAVLNLSPATFRSHQEAQGPMMVSSAVHQQALVGWMVASDRTTLAQAQSEMLGTDLRDRVAAIRAPILVVGTWRGREAMGFTADKVERQIREQYSAAPSLTVSIAERARHFVMLDDPGWLAARISSFIGQ